MKKRFVIVNLFMAVTVLVSILFQSVHAYEHYYEHIAEHCAEHDHIGDKPVITHSHHLDYEKCGICDFVFSPFTSFEVGITHFNSATLIVSKPEFPASQNIPFFKGSLFALRGPPTV